MGKSISYLILLFIAGLLFMEGAHAQSSKSDWIDDNVFCLSDEGDIANIWGNGKSIPGVYFKGGLPAFFKRRLEFSESDFKTSKLKWIFTGKDGGVTVTISSDSIKLEQRYYDSFGYNKTQDGKIVASRYPQSQFMDFKAALQDKKINSLTLEVAHDLKLKLLINDTLVSEQTTQIDFSRHQLLAEGLKMTVCGKLQVPKVSEVSIKIDATKIYQEIMGFGGITSPVAYNMLSEAGKEKWWGYLKDYNLLIQREYPMGVKLKENYSNWDSLDEATPHYYGDNFPNGEVSDFSYNKKIQDLDGMVVFEFWGFPEWMMIKTLAKEKGAKEEPIYDKYADAIIDYCKTSQQKTGKAPAIVGIQNEVKQSAEVWQQLTLHLREALDANGFEKVKIHMHNASNLKKGIEALKAFTTDKIVWQDIDFSASNLYDFQQYFNNPDGYDNVIALWNQSFNGNKKKPFISTEMCVNDGKYQSGSYRLAFLMGELYHKNMVDLDAISLMYCWLLVNNTQPSFSASRSLFTIDESSNNVPTASSYQLRVFGAFSRHLPKGYQRIEATSSDEDLLISAYSNGNKNTIIVLNRGTAPKKINIEALSQIERMELVSPYEENRKVKILCQNQIVIEPGSIVTFF